MKFAWILINFALFGSCFAASSGDLAAKMKAPALLELRDQFERLQRLAFPATNVVVLTIADHQGSEEIEGWVTALKSRYAGRIEIYGIADVRRVPALLRSRVRKKFQEKQQYPVMMDWSGGYCEMFGSRSGVANVFVIARDGVILSTQYGRATEGSLKGAFATIDGAADPVLIHAHP